MTKTTDNRLTTDKFFDLTNGAVKYRGTLDDMTKFVENTQLLDEKLWALFVEQYRSNVDDLDKGWRCEYWGKMMCGGCLTYTYTKNPKLMRVLEATVKDMLTAQQKDGRFSTYSVEAEFDGWDLWGRKHTLLGFMAFYDICQKDALKAKILKALIKHADYILKFVGPKKKNITKCTSGWEGMNVCSILEPFMKLYNLTGEKRYLDFASYIVDLGFTETTNLIDLAYEGKKYPYQYKVTKANEMIRCFQGLLEYYRVTKNEKHLIAVENFAKLVYESDITAIGCAGCTHELFDHSFVQQTKKSDLVAQETCVTVTWMNLCYQLLCFTGEQKYADWIEQSAVNAMTGSVNSENNKKVFVKAVENNSAPVSIDTHGIFLPFDSYSPLVASKRALAVGGYKIMEGGTFYGCCACIGSAGTALAVNFGVMEYDGGFVINLYNKGILKLNGKDGEPFQIKVDENVLTGNGKIKLIFQMEKAQELEFKLRIPVWSKNTVVMYNGQSYDGVVEGEYLTVKEEFNDKDVLEIDVDNRIKLIENGGKVCLVKAGHVLARDERYGENIEEKIEIANVKGVVKGKLIKKGLFKADAEFEIPLKNGKTITVCDYASSGKEWDNVDKRRVSIWL